MTRFRISTFLIVLCISVVSVYGQNKVLINGSQTTLDYIKIKDIRNVDMWTEVIIQFNMSTNVNANLHPPTGKSPFKLKDKSGKEHLIVYQRGWNGPDTGGYGSIQLTSGMTKTVSLFFNKLDINEIYSLNESNCEGDGCWFFNDIEIIDQKKGSEITEGFGQITSSKADQNVFENGKKGIRIIVDMSAFNLAQQSCQFVIKFMNPDESFIKAVDQSFANADGDLSVAHEIEPGYTISFFPDMTFFIPYEQFGLTSGEKKVKIDFDINDSSGELIDHITIFDYTLRIN